MPALRQMETAHVQWIGLIDRHDSAQPFQTKCARPILLLNLSVTRDV
jgi:hypothetical protein